MQESYVLEDNFIIYQKTRIFITIYSSLILLLPKILKEIVGKQTS